MDMLRTWVCLQRLRSNVRHTPERLRVLQDNLFRAAVTHAYDNVPFYRRVWDEMGVEVSAIRGVQDLDRIPVINGHMVREAASRGELLARGVDPSSCTYLDTSGSSGRSLRIWKQSHEERVRRAVGLRIWFEHGFRWHWMTAQFQIKPGPSHVLQRFGVSRKTWISTERSIDEQLARFLDAKADVVVGTATALRRIARAIEAHGAMPKQPRIVFCAGELLDWETSGLVKRVLGVDPIGLYGQTEVGYVAWQCEQRAGFHVNADTHFVEVLSGGKPVSEGDLGTIVVTDLRTRTMPLLRYDTGDLALAARGPCACGREFPTLGSIEGRARGSVLLEDGRILTTRAIIDHLARRLPLGGYRLYQENTKGFRLELTREAFGEPRGAEEGARSRGDHAAVVSHLRQILGGVEISINNVEPWPADGTGKTHTVFSAAPILNMWPGSVIGDAETMPVDAKLHGSVEATSRAMSGSRETRMVASLVPARHWTLRLAWQRTGEIVREEGLRTLWFRILGELGYRRVMLLKRCLLEPIPDATPRLPVTIGLLEKTEITEYLEFRVGTPVGEIERRLEAGHCCFVARYQGHLVASSWAAIAQAWMHYLACEVQVASDEVYIYDSFTRPDCRGRGVSPAIGIEMLHHFRAAGYRRAVRTISPENRANLQAVGKTGYRPYGVMGYVKVGPWRRDFYRTQRKDGHT